MIPTGMVPAERLVRTQLERAHHHWTAASIASDPDEGYWRAETERWSVELQRLRAAA